MVTKDTLISFLENLDSLENKTLALYAIVRDWEDSVMKKINIDTEASEWLMRQYSTLARSYLWNEIVFKDIDDYDEEDNKNVYYYFEECTPEMEFIKDIEWWIQDIFSVDEIKKIEWIIVKIWNENEFCNFYIPYYPLYLLDREKWALIIPDNDQFKSLDSNKILRFNNQITFLYYENPREDIVLSLDFGKIEKYFGYGKIFESKAKIKLTNIETLGFVSHFDKFRSYIENKKWLRNKLIKIKDTSEVLSKSKEEIGDFIKWKPFLSAKISFDSDWKIDITSEEKARIFLKILDDDYLKSDLTEWEYDADKKSKIPKIT